MELEDSGEVAAIAESDAAMLEDIEESEKRLCWCLMEGLLSDTEDALRTRPVKYAGGDEDDLLKLAAWSFSDISRVGVVGILCRSTLSSRRLAEERASSSSSR